MKTKNLIIGVIALVLAVTGIIFISRHPAPKKEVRSAPHASSGEREKPFVRKLSKDMGGLTVKTLNSKNEYLLTRVKAFKIVDSNSSIYITSFNTNRMQELPPGNYDIELDTIPQRIFKNIKVHKGREGTEDIGCITGTLKIKAVSYKKKDAHYPIRILYPGSGVTVYTDVTNRPVDIVSGAYDIEVLTYPRQFKKNIKIEAGKDTVVDIGCTCGALMVKAADEKDRTLRYGVRIKSVNTNETITTGITNKPIEVMQGTYDVEILSFPMQVKKGVKINVGEESVVNLIFKAPSLPQKTTLPVPAIPKKSR